MLWLDGLNILVRCYFTYFQTALEIAKRGGTIHMVCRNPKYADEAKTEIVQETKNDNVFVHILDMSDPKAVSKFASDFHQPVNVLINNAGCMVSFMIYVYLLFSYFTQKVSSFVCQNYRLMNVQSLKMDSRKILLRILLELIYSLRK